MVECRDFLLILICFLYIYKQNSTNKPEIIPHPTPIPVPTPDPIPEPVEQIRLIDVPKYRESESGTIYGDVISHTKKPYGDKAGRGTNVHESAHHIVSDTRRDNVSKYGYNIQALYYGSGKGIILDQPNIKIKDVSIKIPTNLRSYRYQLYFVSQLGYWNDYPLYILDEWTAYVWGGSSDLEDYKNKQIHSRSDSVSGCLDFSIYALYLCLVIKEKDPNYWENNKQFKLVIKHFLKIAEKTFIEGKDIFPSQKQTELLEKFKNLPNDHEIKQLLISEFDSMFLLK